MQENSNQILIREALRLASTPTGQQLLTLLRQKGDTDLNAAMDSALTGDYTQAAQALKGFLDDPQAKKLLQELGR